MVIKVNTPMQESFLVFSVQSNVYAIQSSHVVELIWLPELTRIESNSFFVVGYFNFRGEFVPIIDLNLRQGMKTKRYSVNDRILVITQDKPSQMKSLQTKLQKESFKLNLVSHKSSI